MKTLIVCLLLPLLAAAQNAGPLAKDKSATVRFREENQEVEALKKQVAQLQQQVGTLIKVSDNWLNKGQPRGSVLNLR